MNLAARIRERRAWRRPTTPAVAGALWLFALTLLLPLCAASDAIAAHSSCAQACAARGIACGRCDEARSAARPARGWERCLEPSAVTAPDPEVLRALTERSGPTALAVPPVLPGPERPTLTRARARAEIPSRASHPRRPARTRAPPRA